MQLIRVHPNSLFA